MSLELLYYGAVAAKDIKNLDAAWKMEWRDYLDCMVGERRAWSFPYRQGGTPPMDRYSSQRES